MYGIEITDVHVCVCKPPRKRNLDEVCGSAIVTINNAMRLDGIDILKDDRFPDGVAVLFPFSPYMKGTMSDNGRFFDPFRKDLEKEIVKAIIDKYHENEKTGGRNGV